MGQTLDKCAHSHDEVNKHLERLQRRSVSDLNGRDSASMRESVGAGGNQDTTTTTTNTNTGSSSFLPLHRRGASAERTDVAGAGALDTSRPQNSRRVTESPQGGASAAHQKGERLSKTARTVGFAAGSPEPPPPPPLVPRPGVNVYNLIDDDDLDNTCPTCLESYTFDNPRIEAFCGHAFHLSCIYDWMERSPYCAVCARPMRFCEKGTPDPENTDRCGRASSDSSWWTRDASESTPSSESGSVSEGLDMEPENRLERAPVPRASLSKSLSERMRGLTTGNWQHGDAQLVPSGAESSRATTNQLPESAESEHVQTIEMKDLIQWDEQVTLVAAEPTLNESPTIAGQGPSSTSLHPASERPIETEAL